jgi:hypothetical protein
MASRLNTTQLICPVVRFHTSPMLPSSLGSKSTGIARPFSLVAQKIAAPQLLQRE